MAERLRRLARNILRRCSAEEIVAENPDWWLIDAWPYGDVYALEQLWRRVGFDEVIEDLLKDRQIDFAVERAVFAYLYVLSLIHDL